MLNRSGHTRPIIVPLVLVSKTIEYSIFPRSCFRRGCSHCEVHCSSCNENDNEKWQWAHIHFHKSQQIMCTSNMNNYQLLQSLHRLHITIKLVKSMANGWAGSVGGGVLGVGVGWRGGGGGGWGLGVGLGVGWGWGEGGGGGRCWGACWVGWLMVPISLSLLLRCDSNYDIEKGVTLYWQQATTFPNFDTNWPP